MNKAMHLAVLLSFVVWVSPVSATPQTGMAGAVSGIAAETAQPSTAPANDLVIEYGDPDDAITGNRNNGIVDGTQNLVPTGSALLSAELVHWLFSAMASVVPSF